MPFIPVRPALSAAFSDGEETVLFSLPLIDKGKVCKKQTIMGRSSLKAASLLQVVSLVNKLTQCDIRHI